MTGRIKQNPGQRNRLRQIEHETGEEPCPKRQATPKKKIATLSHDEAGRLNIPKAEVEPLLGHSDKSLATVAFAEFTDVFGIQQGFEDKVEEAFNNVAWIATL